MRTLRQDLRYTLRQLRNAPVFALTAVLTLALGLGATTAMLAIVDSVLMRPVALPHPERIVMLTRHVHGDAFGLTSEDLQLLAAKGKSFAAVAGFSTLPAPVTSSAGTRIADLVSITPNFFSVAEVRAHMGRVLSAADARASVAVVSDEFWRGPLAASPRVIGSTIKVENRLLTIVGVMPPNFSFPQSLKGEMLYVPLLLNDKGKDEHGFESLQIMARLRPGVTFAAALGETRAVYGHAVAAYKGDWGQLGLRPYREVMTGYEQPALLALLCAVALLLLIACANSANLQIVRGIARTGEMQVRAALGASRARLLQQIVIESVTVSLLGAALALLLSYGIVHSIRAVYGEQFARFDELALHPAVFASCALLAILTGIFAALAPAWNAMRTVASLPSAQSMRVTRRSRLSGSLVALEIALTCVLLTGAGLFLRTFRALEHAPLGFDPHHVTEITLMPVNPLEDVHAFVQTYDRLLDRLRSLPGVEAAATQTSMPFSRFTLGMNGAFRIPGQSQNKKAVETDFTLVSADYNRTMGVQMLAGRGFLPSDSAGTQPVCLVNEAFVRRFLAGQRTLGNYVEFTKDATDGTDNRLMKAPLAIVGVMPDEIDGGELSFRPGPTVSVDYKQFSTDQPMARFLFGLAPQFAVRSTLPEATLLREIRSVLKESAPDMAEMKITPIDDAIAFSLTMRRLALRLAAVFGLVALLLAAVGIYGVLAYSVAQRTREIGIRMALGSTRQGAMKLVLRQAAVMVAAGLAIGFVCAWPAGRAVRSFLFGVKPLDPLTLIATALVLLVVCACAAAVPAYRATQVDPIEALRAE